MMHPVLSRRALVAGGAALLATPALSQGQSDVVRIGHLTPRTGFLGPLGEYAVQGVQLAAEEVNAAGGIAGRRVELLLEDSVNPQTASAKAERYIQRDRVSCIVGEINSASALAICALGLVAWSQLGTGHRAHASAVSITVAAR